MSSIIVSNLSFHYDGSYDNIFENVSFSIDTNWKLGFIGRNGRGKTTFFNLLMGKYDYSGNIISNVHFDYFPFEVKDKSKNSYEIASEINLDYEDYEQWKLEREVSLLEMNPEYILTRPFETLSKGEQTKVLLAILFLRENNFLLIDEPTNHLDAQSRVAVAKYLKSKRSFILVSHDRTFLDTCVDHVLSINRANIEIQQGNFSSWWENKKRQDNFELGKNQKLKKDITRLEQSAKQATGWSHQIEGSKSRDTSQSDSRVDKGFIGHKAAKMAQRAQNTQNRRDKAVEDKSKLLKNIETVEDLKLDPLTFRSNRLIDVSNLSIFYGKNQVCQDVSFVVNNGDRIQLKGNNGCGKSSIIKLILGQNLKYDGNLFVATNLKISYVSQDTSFLMGNPTNFARANNIDESFFKSVLRKLDFTRIQFEKNMENYSEGQKKKVLIAKSLCEQADLYIWDEPLNYIDILSRIQIEDVILNYCPTMIFVEHDELFSQKVATEVVLLENSLKKNEILKTNNAFLIDKSPENANINGIEWRKNIMKAKIAVVVPVYNAENFIRKGIDSLLNQSFKDIKIICVNDASQDNCGEILNEYAKMDSRIVVINHELNKGAGVARNTGLDYIYNNFPDVEYISLFDADDRLELNTYEKAYGEAKKTDADILNFNFLPSTYWQYKTAATSDTLDYDGNCLDAIFEHKEFYTFVVCWSKLYKKELLRNIRFSDMKFFEDGSFAYKVLPRAQTMRVIPDTLYEYNIENPESTSWKTNSLNRLKAIFNTIKETFADWEKLGILEKYKFQYIQHILFYASLVCPDVLEGDYASELNDSFGFNILDEETMNNLPEGTKNQILKMTKK